MAMFDVFVTGPIGLAGFGLARRCVLCRGREGTHAAGCAGFGDGCLATRSDTVDPRVETEPAATPAAERK